MSKAGPEIRNFVSNFLFAYRKGRFTRTMLNKSQMASILLGLLWLGGVVKGTMILWDYQNAPGKQGVPPARWPRASRVPRSAAQPMLVMVVHPHCPCSRASMGELALLMTRLQRRLSACVLFVQPEGFTDNWEKTDLWHSASATRSMSWKRYPSERMS